MAIAASLGRTCRGALRVNPDVDPRTHRYTTTGRRETKFGVDIDRCPAFFERHGRDPNCLLRGLHLHIGSPVEHMDPYVEVIERTLAEAGVSPEELAVVIPHQSNLRIIDSAREKLGLPKEKMFTNIQNCGNTSAASIAMGLDECRKTGRLTTGDIVLMVAFGAGWTWASALIRM